MSETAHERHGRLAREFVQMAATQTGSTDELMAVVESAILATMHLLVKGHGIKAGHASIYLEAALQAATERFASNT